jgi:hypothetical protein
MIDQAAHPGAAFRSEPLLSRIHEGAMSAYVMNSECK